MRLLDIYAGTQSSHATGLLLMALTGSGCISVFDFVGNLRTQAGYASPSIAGVDDAMLRATCFDHAVYVQGGNTSNVIVERNVFREAETLSWIRRIRTGQRLCDRCRSAHLRHRQSGRCHSGWCIGRNRSELFIGAGDFEADTPGCSGRVKGRAMRIGNTRDVLVDRNVITASSSSQADTLSPIVLDGESACLGRVPCVAGLTISRMITMRPTPLRAIEIRGAVEYVETQTHWAIDPVAIADYGTTLSMTG